MHPSAVDNVTGLTESPWFRLQKQRGLKPLKASDKVSQEDLSQQSLARFGLRALVTSQGVDGYTMALKSPDGHVIQVHGFQWNPAVLAVQPPVFSDKSGISLPSGSLFGAAISNTIETFNRSIEEYGHIRRVQSQIIYDDDDKETEQADIFAKALEKREDSFALYRDTPLWMPVYDRNGDPIPGQFEQSPNHNSLTMADPGHYALDDQGVWRFLSGISSDTAMEYGIHNFPTKMMRGGVNRDAFYPHDVGGKSRWNRKTTRTTGVDESWPDRGGDSGWAVPGQRFSYDRFNGTPERYVLTGDAVRQYQIANPERRALSDRISREIYDLQMQRHSMASGRYTVIAQRERTKSTRQIKKYSTETQKDWAAVAKEWATTTFSENIPTIHDAENDPNRNDMPVAEFLADGIKTFLSKDQHFIHHFADLIQTPEIQEAISSVLCKKFDVASLGDLAPEIQEVINEKMSAATQEAKATKLVEKSDKEHVVPSLVITGLHGQDIVTGSYRLFSRSLESSVVIPCALMDNDDKETILFFPRDPKDENNLFLGMRAGNRIEWRGGKSTISRAIPENRGDHNSPIFIKSVSITPAGAYCTLSKSQETFSDELKEHIKQHNPTETKTDGSLGVRISQDELVPILPSQIRPYDGFIEQHGQELPSSLFTNMLLPTKQRELAEQKGDNTTIREEILRYFNNAATKRDALQASGVDANGSIIPNERSGFLRKIGIDVGVEDSHYMFASMNPEDYTWIKESEPEVIDLQDPMYYLASTKALGTTARSNAIRKSRQSADQQDYNIQLWSLNHMKKVAHALVVKGSDAINGHYDVKSLLTPEKYTNDDGEEIIQEPDDDYKKIMQEDDYIPIEHLKDPNQAMQTLILALEIDAFRSITPHGQGGYDEKGNPDSDGEYDQHGNHILEFIEIPKEITDISQNSAMKQFKDAYGYAISDQYIKLIGMNGLLSELLNSRNEETLSDLKSVHPEIGTMFEKALNISDRYAKTNDKEEKSRLRTEGLEISQDIVYAQMSDVLKRIKGYSALSPLQKLAFVELDNLGIVGNFSKLRMGVPKASYQLDGTDVSDEQCQKAALVISGLASSSVSGNNMANNKGLYRSDGLQKIDIMQHEINPDAFQAVIINKKLTHVRALDYPEIDPKIRDLAKLSDQVAFKGNPSEAKFDEMIRITADFPECQAELIDAKKTFMDKGQLSRPERLKIIRTVGVRLGLSHEDLPYGMLKNMKDTITTAMALTVASQAQMHAMWTQRKQEDALVRPERGEKPVGKRQPLDVTLNALPLGLSGEHQTFADHGHSGGSTIFDGTVPSVLPKPIHAHEEFLPPDKAERELGRRTIRLSDGREFKNELLMPARLPERETKNGQIVKQLDAESMFEDVPTSSVTSSLPTFDYDHEIRTSPRAIRASMAGYASPRWSMLMLLGDDDGENSLIKQYLRVPQNNIGESIWKRLTEGNALNGILMAGNIGLGKDEDVVIPKTAFQPEQKMRGTNNPLRIDGLDNELGRARTTSGVYLSFNPSADNITYDDSKKQVTIKEAVFTHVEKSRQGSFSRKRKMNAPLVISWQVDDGKTKINMSDIRKKLYFFTQILDEDAQQLEPHSQERLAIDKTGLPTDIISIMPAHAERLMDIAKKESDKRIGAEIASFADLFGQEHHTLASAFRAMWEAPTSFDSLPGVAGAQKQKAIYDATGWSVSGPEQIKAAFLSPAFAAASSGSTWGTRGIVVGRINHKSETLNKDLAIVFVPMKPSEAMWFDATDHEDRTAKILEEKLAHQAEAMGHVRSVFHSILTGSSHDPGKTVDEEKRDSPYWNYGKRWDISKTKEDGARFGRPVAAGPEAAALKAARSINQTTKNPMTLGRFVLMRIDTNQLDQIKNEDGTPSDALWISLSDSTAGEHKSLLSNATAKRDEYTKAMRAAGISDIPRMSEIRAFSLGSLSADQQKILAARTAYEAWRAATTILKQRNIQPYDEGNLIFANPAEDVVASWDPAMTLTHESVAKMAPYMAYWLTQVAQLQDGKDDIHYVKTLDGIAKKRGLSAENQRIIDKLKQGILEKVETTQIARGKEDLLPEQHIPGTMHKKSSEELGIFEIPDFMLKPDPEILDRKIGFSTEKMIQVIDQLPPGLRTLINEKIQLAIISHNGARHEFPSIITPPAGELAGEPAYTWRNGNVIYASTIGIDPQNDFLNNLADIFAGEVWLPDEGKEYPDENQRNIFEKSKIDTYNKSKEYANAVVQRARSLREQDNFAEMHPTSKKWIESIIQCHENATQQASENVTRFYPASTEEDKESYIRNYSLRKVALNLHREWFKGVVARGGPIQRFVRNNKTRTNSATTQYNGTPAWLDVKELDGTTPATFSPYYLRTALKQALSEGKRPEQWEGWDTIARPRMTSMLREEELQPLMEQREKLDLEQKGAALYGLDTKNPLDSTDKRYTGALAITAFAGTGKTRTIVHRVAELVNLGFKPEEFFIASFTRVSSKDLRDRINQNLEKTGFIAENNKEFEFKTTQVHTWHGHALFMLRNDIPVPAAFLASPDEQSGQPLIQLYTTEVYDKASKIITHQKNEFFTKENIKVVDDQNFEDRNRLAALLKKSFLSTNVPVFAYKNGQRKSRVQDFRSYIDQIKSLGITPAQYEQQLDMKGETDIQARQFSKVYARYQALMAEQGLVDQTDLLNMVVSILKRNPAVLSMYQQKYRQFLVDEYQDQNGAQEQLLRLLSDKKEGGSGNVTVVGDPKQAIYAWRGSTAKYLKDFSDNYRYENAEKKEIVPGIMTIKTNYRSTEHIVDVGNGIRGTDEPGFSHTKMQANPAALKGSPVQIVSCDDEDSQASFIANEIKRLVAGNNNNTMTPKLSSLVDEPISTPGYGDMMIVTRLLYQAQSLQRELQSRGIPATIDHGASSVASSKERTPTVPQTISALLQSSNEKDSAHLNELADIFSLAKDALSDNASYGLLHQASQDGKISVMTTIARILRRNNIALKPYQINALLAAYDTQMETAQTQDEKISLMRFILNNQGTKRFFTASEWRPLRAVAESIEQNDIPGRKSLSNIIMHAVSEGSLFGDKLRDIANKSVINKNFDPKEIKEFLSDLNFENLSPREIQEKIDKLENKINQISDKRNEDQEVTQKKMRQTKDAVRILTIHVAKGTEARVVFNAYWNEGSIPISRSENRGPESRQEERNLAYVSSTRAKERNYFVYPKNTITKKKSVRLAMPSRFIGEIPANNSSFSEYENGTRTFKRHPDTSLDERVEQLVHDPALLAQIFKIEPTTDYENLVDRFRRMWTEPKERTAPSGGSFWQVLFDGVPSGSESKVNPWGSLPQANNGNILNGQYSGAVDAAGIQNVTKIRNVRGNPEEAPEREETGMGSAMDILLGRVTPSAARVRVEAPVNIVKAIKDSVSDGWHAVISSGDEPDIPDAVNLIIKYLSKKPRQQKTIRDTFDLPSYTMPSDEELGVGEWSTDEEYWDTVLQNAAADNHDQLEKKFDEILDQIMKERGGSISPRLV
jgi:superfamily I DNA/RNA helicase